MMRQPEWNKYEVALLIEAYWRIKTNPFLKAAVVSSLSITLRSRSSNVDETYRNENGINMRLGELDYLFSTGKYGLKNTSDLFRSMVEMYQNNRTEFDSVLHEAKKQFSLTSIVENRFRNWLQKKDAKIQIDSICDLLLIVETFCIKNGVLSDPLFEIADSETIKKVVEIVAKNIVFRLRYRKLYPAILDAINLYYSFVLVMPSLCPPKKAAHQDEESASKDNLLGIPCPLNEDTIRDGDIILNYFDSIKKNFPEFTFSNVNAKGEICNRAVYIYYNTEQRHGNVLFEIWHVTKLDVFYLYIKRYLLNDDEYQESLSSWNKTTDNRGRIIRKWHSKQSLIDYLIPKIELAKESVNYIVSPSDALKESGSSHHSSIYDTFFASFSQWFKNEGELTLNNSIDECIAVLLKAESFARDHGFTPYSICTLDASASIGVMTSLIQNDEFKQYNEECGYCFPGAFKLLLAYFEFELKLKQSASDGTENKVTELGKKIADILRDSPNGITKEEIKKMFPECRIREINRALDYCDPVIVLGKYYHKDCISDYQEMADTLLSVLLKQFSQNGDYTSALQLYNEVRPKLDDFFFYNNAFDSRQEVYDLALHLFEREKYKGYSFIFANSMHIWKEEPNYPKDFHGLLIKYAREHGNVFSREEALAYYEQIGSTTSAATFSNVIFHTGSNSFLQYAENQFVLTEAIQINDYFLSSVSAQIEVLLEGEDYIAIGEIDDYFYTTLPTLPSGVSWSALLLEDVLRIFETGFITMEAGKDNDKKTFPAAIVRKHSHYQSFSDVVWDEVSKSCKLPQEFTASEFREFLLNKGFIRGSEKMWNVHKTVAGDIRFYWTDNYGKVTIN